MIERAKELLSRLERVRTGDSVLDRRQAVAEATRIFVQTGLEKDITKAFRLYQELTGEEFPVTITKESKYNLFPRRLRPRCPDCGKPMGLELLNTTRRNQVGANEAGISYKSCWICPNQDCGYIGDWSVNTPHDWRLQLMEEERKNELR